MARKEPTGRSGREAIDRRRPRFLVDGTQDGPIGPWSEQVADEDRPGVRLALDGVGDVVGSHARRRDCLEPDVAIGDSLAIRQLADFVGEVPPATRAAVDRDVQPEGEALGTGRVIRVDVGQRNRDDLAARGAGRAEESPSPPRPTDRRDRRARAAADRRDRR